MRNGEGALRPAGTCGIGGSLAASEKVQRRGLRRLGAVLLLLLGACGPAFALTAAEQIAQEATAPNSETNHPLPLAASWNPGSQWDTANTSYTPTWQLQMIAQGHHLLPWFGLPGYAEGAASSDWAAWVASMQGPLQQTAALGLPVAFLGTQWEQNLYQEEKYLTLFPASNALVQVPGVVPGTTLGADTVRIVTAGSGYQVGDVLTVVGGAGTVPANITVSAVGATGNVVHESITSGGAYTILPANPVTVTGGSGTGATFRVYDGAIKFEISPLGAIAPWQAVGVEWSTSQAMQALQSWYPNPPLVLFISNNEATKLNWTDANTDQHYVSAYGPGQTDEAKREAVAQGWIDRYRALQQAWRNNLMPTWQGSSKFIGYEAFGPSYFGRWFGWTGYSLYNTNRIDPSPLMWDGGSASYYLAFNDPPSDSLVFSPQVEAMNYDFMLKEAYGLNPGFWFELSTWNGCDWYPSSNAPATNGDCATLNKNIPNYTADRYAGMVQFTMWQTRPRVVRDFRGYAEPRSQNEPLFDVLVSAVDRVYTNPYLTRFWRSGQLVPNTSRPHPYQSGIPAEYQSVNRMFMLTTNLDPSLPWTLTTPLPVYALARVIGVAPGRQWLVYASAPSGLRTGVQVTIPGYQTITVDAAVAGSFYLVDEAMGLVSSLGNGDPGSVVGPIPGGDNFVGDGSGGTGSGGAGGSDASAGSTGPDTSAPVAAITAPATGNVVGSGPVSVTVAASDNAVVTRVELWANGLLVGSTNIAPYAFIWDASSFMGDVALVAKAYDAAGNIGTSGGVTVTVMSSM